MRETSGIPEVLAVILGQDAQPGVRLGTLVTTVDEIERRTGIDFLTELPDGLESSIESNQATAGDWQLDTALDTNFRPQQRDFCTLARVRRDQFTYDQ